MAVTISLAITQNSQNIADNTSNVTVKATVKWTYGSWNGTGECYGSIKIDGTNYSFSGLKFNTGKTTSGSQVIMTKTVNVKHSSDGTKTLNCSTSFYTGVSSGTISASASKTLTTIPRKSTLSASNGTLGTPQLLTVNRKSSNFTHTIKYTCGSASGTVCTKSGLTDILFKPTEDLASQNTTGTSVSIKLTITTYNGDTSLGSNTKTITCSIPSSVKPSCSIILTDAADYPVFIKGYSKFKILVAPILAYDSLIDSYSVKANGVTYSASNVTTSVLASSGELTITATVKDKRGRTGTVTKTVTVYDKSTLSASNGTLGTEQTLTISRSYPGFKHDITYTCGKESGTVVKDPDATSVKFTPPISLARQNTKGTTVSIKFTITTYINDKSIGTNTKTITCGMPMTVSPYVDISIVDTTGYDSIYGGMVKGMSKPKVTLYPSTSFDSPIVSCNSIVFVGSNPTTKKYTTESFEIGSITSTDNISILSTVTDARGREWAETKAITGILDYSLPVISKLSVGRCDEDETPNDIGEFVLVTFSASVTPLNNKNRSVFVLRYKKTTEEDYPEENMVVFSDEYSITNRTFKFAAETDSSYDVNLSVNDALAPKPTTKTTSASTASVIMHFGIEGKSVAIGKIAEIAELFDVAWNARFRKNVQMENEKSICGYSLDGTEKDAFQPQNANGNTVIGWGNYDKASGNTNVYGHDVNIGVSNIANPSTFRPYRRRGDTLTVSLRTAGYVTNGKKDISFWIPFSVPIIGAPDVTVACLNGFQLRQGDKYLCGSSADNYTIPDSIEVGATIYNGIYVKAVFSDTTNVTNNDTVGIYFNGTITFS